MNRFSDNIERMKSRHVLGTVFCLAASVLYTPMAFAAGTGLARVEVQPPPDTTPGTRLVVFQPDSSDLQPMVCIAHAGQPVLAFTPDGSKVLSANELGSMGATFLGTDGDSSRFALLRDGKYTGVDAIVNSATGENSARVTFLDADNNPILEGTMFTEVPNGLPAGDEQNPNVAVITWALGFAVGWLWICVGRCDRCTDTCNNGDCDGGACDTCFGDGCG